MQNIPTKSPGDKFFSAELNSINNELQNIIINGGIPLLDPADLNQIGKAIANIVGSVNFYSDTGVADAYVLNVTGTFQSPTVYTIGMLVRFRASVENTGAANVNVSSLGVQNIKKADGTTDPELGDIPTNQDTFLRYDGTNFRILGNEINNLAVNLLLKTIFSGTPVADTIQWINNVNNVTDLAATGYGVGRRFNLSDANPLKSAGIAGFAETNNAASVGLAMFIFNSANFLKVAQLRSPADTENGIETYFEAQSFGNFILNTPITVASNTVDFFTEAKESGIVFIMGIGGGDTRFKTSFFVYGGDGFGASLSLDIVGSPAEEINEATDNTNMFTVAFLSTLAGVHTFRITGSSNVNQLPDEALYVVKMPFRNEGNL